MNTNNSILTTILYDIYHTVIIRIISKIIVFLPLGFITGILIIYSKDTSIIIKNLIETFVSMNGILVLAFYLSLLKMLEVITNCNIIKKHIDVAKSELFDLVLVAIAYLLGITIFGLCHDFFLSTDSGSIMFLCAVIEFIIYFLIFLVILHDDFSEYISSRIGSYFNNRIIRKILWPSILVLSLFLTIFKNFWFI